MRTTKTIPESHIAGREREIKRLLSYLGEGDCCSVVGMSNVGKSELLRAAYQFEVRPQTLPESKGAYMLVYIDLNLMLEMTEQGFYEIIIRSLLTEMQNHRADGGLREHISQSYENIVNPKSEFLISHAFNQALTTFTQEWTPGVVFFFDEFDHPFATIEGRVFLNLRALRDRYGHRLLYVTATCRRLHEIRGGREAGEYCELFTHQTVYLPPLQELHARVLIDDFIQDEHIPFDAQEIELILSHADGHPALLESACYVMSRMKSEEKSISLSPRFRQERLQERLDSDQAIHAECAKLWLDLSPNERKAMLACVALNETPDPEIMTSLQQLYLVRETPDGPRPFCSLFQSFVRRRRFDQRAESRGIRIDVEAGSVQVDGVLLPPLTELEYRLLLLLYGHLDQICDKYSIVEAVWGVEYIDEVDDARIEKLVSRLRQKVEPNPSQPSYLLTVRGRGYRLVSQ